MAKSKRRNNTKWRFTVRERRAVLFLLPLVAALVWILWTAGRPRIDPSARLVGDAMTAPAANASYGGATGATGSGKAISGTDNGRVGNKNNTQRGSGGSNNLYGNVAESPAGDPKAERSGQALFRFDPNTAAYEDFRAMGIARATAAGIVKYRERGKVFQIPEDFATCYGISDSMYAALKPYIDISAEFRLPPKPVAPARISTSATAVESTATERRTPETSATEQFKSTGDNNFAASKNSENSIKSRNFENPVAPKRKLVELNTADSLELLSAPGIGGKSVSAIMAYRELLGGFHSVEQLTELDVVLEKNYELMRSYIWADSCVIRKIDINFASPNTLAEHPYMKGKVARRILSKRQLKGGWSTIEDMIEDNTLTSDEAARLAPYLQFTTASIQ